MHAWDAARDGVARADAASLSAEVEASRRADGLGSSCPASKVATDGAMGAIPLVSWLDTESCGLTVKKLETHDFKARLRPGRKK